MDRPKATILLLVYAIKTLELTLESLRLCLMTHGYAGISSLLSTVDVGLSLVVLGFVVKHLNSRSVLVSYCLGYGTGNYLGTKLFSLLV
jgi:uncharacterized protein YebE (UPF0316 family)